VLEDLATELYELANVARVSPRVPKRG